MEKMISEYMAEVSRKGWEKISPEERSARAKELAKKRWERTSPEQRKAHTKMMRSKKKICK